MLYPPQPAANEPVKVTVHLPKPEDVAASVNAACPNCPSPAEIRSVIGSMTAPSVWNPAASKTVPGAAPFPDRVQAPTCLPVL